MATTGKCTVCGGELTIDAPGGICRKCLLGRAVENPLSNMSSVLDKTEIDSASPTSPPASLPRSGQQFGSYRLIRLLGQGGMGAVFEADDLESERRVALKVLNHSLDSLDARKRFLREGRLAASINHPNTVYVYGTEEIEGIPAISMEFVPGGTLKERIQKRGPLPVTEAVDVTLQIIAGLEAAQSIGVLHRDIKPSNCFVDSDGAIKIGDFGLSISTVTRGETHLTMSGAVMGTPAFSSPEQLRGDELDVRSDIYSVGVTLYFLLTGRTPFEGENLVKLLTTVLERAPESPAKLRPEIPKPLAQAVLRCLTKQRTTRFKNYDELRKELLPYSSLAPMPATLGLRSLAGFVDYVALYIIAILFEALWFPTFGLTDMAKYRTDSYPLFQTATLLIRMLYFAVPEGLWGLSLGKAFFGLRVVSPDRKVPRFPWALLRATVYAVLPSIPVLILYGSRPEDLVTGMAKATGGVLLLLYSGLFLTFALFCTARRRNGFAAVHDLISRTRVVSRAAHQTRPSLEPAAASSLGTESGPTIGPYQVLGSLCRSEADELILGYDLRLLRKVWIHRTVALTPPVLPGFRNIGRVGRIRWLNGKRSADECWDAYEAVEGQSLLDLLTTPQPWKAVRYWLADLAGELNAGQKDRTLPETLALNRVWITSDGRAKLLDFPAPCTNKSDSPLSIQCAAGFPSVRMFLHQITTCALNGKNVGNEEARALAVNAPLPIHARSLLDEMPRVESFDLLTNQLKQLLQKPASVSRLRRLGIIGGCAAFPLFMMAFLLFGMLVSQSIFKTYPDIIELRQCLDRLGKLGESRKPERQALETYVAGKFSQTLSDSNLWSNAAVMGLMRGNRRAALEEIVRRHSNPTEAELEDAKTQLKPFLDKIPRSPQKGLRLVRFGFDKGLGVLLVFVAIPALIASFAFRGGLAFHLSGLALVTKDGMAASRARLFGRSVLTWLPIVTIAVLAKSLGSPGMALVVLVLYLGCVVWCILTPERGPQDRLAGTWLVPR